MNLCFKRIASICLLIVMMLTAIPFSTIAAEDLGAVFDARITMNSSSVCVAVSGTNVQLANVAFKAPQIWTFTRQSDGSYEIKHKATGKCLDVCGASSASGTNVQIYADNDTPAQRWFVTLNSNGTYTFRSKAGQCVLDVYAAKLTAGSNIWMYTSNGTVAQQFNIEVLDGSAALVETSAVDLGGDFYATLSNSEVALNLSSTTDVISLEASEKSAEQVWRFTRKSDGSYVVKNQYSGLVLDAYYTVKGINSDFRLYAENGSEAQKWFVCRDGANYVLVSKLDMDYVLGISDASASNPKVDALKYDENSALQIFNVKNIGSYLSYISPSDVGTGFNASISYASKNIAVSGSNVVIYTPSNNSDQVWRFERQTDGSYKIVNNNSSQYVLDVAGASTANGANIQIYKSNDTKAQRWFLYRKEGRYVFCSALSKKVVMDVNGAGTANMTNVHVWEPNFTNAQLFSINVGNMTAMTYNIYCAQFNSTRTNKVLSMIKSYVPDTLGVQEATPEWMNFLKSNLSSTYGFVGVGRDSGGVGEYSAILYNKHIFNLVDSGTKWLSDTPDTVSKFSDSMCNRILTYALLERKTDGKEILFVNTHLDHSTDAVRLKQITVLNEFIKNYGDYPTVLTGDFNTLPSSSVYNATVSAGFADSSTKADVTYKSSTYTNFGSDSRILDYVFITSDIDAKVYKVCTEKVGGSFASDHNPIYLRYTCD